MQRPEKYLVLDKEIDKRHIARSEWRAQPLRENGLNQNKMKKQGKMYLHSRQRDYFWKESRRNKVL